MFSSIRWPFHTLNGRNRRNQLRLEVYPIIYRGLIHLRWLIWDFFHQQLSLDVVMFVRFWGVYFSTPGPASVGSFKHAIPNAVGRSWKVRQPSSCRSTDCTDGNSVKGWWRGWGWQCIEFRPDWIYAVYFLKSCSSTCFNLFRFTSPKF